MAKKYDAPMPLWPELGGTYVVQWAAVDPNDGSDVGGVVVSNAAMLVVQTTPGGPGDLSNGGFTASLPPLFIPLPEDTPSAGDSGDGGS